MSEPFDEYEQEAIEIDESVHGQLIASALSDLKNSDLFDDVDDPDEERELLSICERILWDDPDLILSNDYERRWVKPGDRIIVGKTKSRRGYWYSLDISIYPLDDTRAVADLWVTLAGSGRNVTRKRDFKEYLGNIKISGSGFNSTRIKVGSFHKRCLVIWRATRSRKKPS